MEVRYIELNINHEKKYVLIWLTKEEAADSAFRDSLKPIYIEYKEKKYRVVVFESGRGDLSLLTRDLLKHNIEVLAKKEAK